MNRYTTLMVGLMVCFSSGCIFPKRLTTAAGKDDRKVGSYTLINDNPPPTFLPTWHFAPDGSWWLLDTIRRPYVYSLKLLKKYPLSMYEAFADSIYHRNGAEKVRLGYNEIIVQAQQKKWRSYFKRIYYPAGGYFHVKCTFYFPGEPYPYSVDFSKVKLDHNWDIIRDSLLMANAKVDKAAQIHMVPSSAVNHKRTTKKL